jgi:hypothetical protein
MQESYDGGRFVRRPQDEWCDRCRQRQAIHERYRVLVLQRGAALRLVQRIAGQMDAASFADDALAHPHNEEPCS